MPLKRQETDWLYVPKPLTAPAGRLFCFPFAGGGPSTFRLWPEAVARRNASLEVNLVSLPGHEFRITSPPLNQLEELIPALAHEFKSYFDRPFFFFGYSVGALIAFELARYLRQQGNKVPDHLFVCAKGAPHSPLPHPPIHELPNQEFLEALKRFDGTPTEVLNNEQLMELFLPCLRADFSLNETYRHQQALPLPCPITAFAGQEDQEASPSMIQEWAQHTANTFRIHQYSGGHFFVTKHLDAIIDEITQSIGG